MTAEQPQNIYYVRKTDPPFFFHRGEGFFRTPLPEGTRVIYAPPPVPAVPDLRAALRRALETPIDADPLRSQLKPGLKVTVAFDDISLPIPPMRAPDVRRVIIEELAAMLERAGVEDIHLINAIGLHRKNTPAELRAMVGPEIFRRFFPSRLYNHDAEDPGGIVRCGFTERGEEATLNRRAAESDLLIYVNITTQPMSGGDKSAVVGLGSYRTIRENHNSRVMGAEASYMDPARSELHGSIRRLGQLIEKRVNIFKIETALNNHIFPALFRYQEKRESEWKRWDRVNCGCQKFALSCLSGGMRRAVYRGIRSPYGVTAVFAGRNEPAHRKTLDAVYAQQTVPVKGQADMLVFGVPYIGPYNVNSIMNPLLVHSLALGYVFNLSVPRPLVRKGGVIILMHPLRREFHRVHHLPYIEFFEKVLAETRDPGVIDEKYAPALASNPEYIDAYRFKYAYHGAHPVYMWNWACRGAAHVGMTIAVSPESPEAARRLGYAVAPTFEAALEMGREFLNNRRPEITYFHLPPIFLCSVE